MQCAFRGRRTAPVFAVDAIDAAVREILVSAYSLTMGSRTVEAVIQAKRRGVDVRIIADRTTPRARKSDLDPLAEAGVPI